MSNCYSSLSAPPEKRATGIDISYAQKNYTLQPHHDFIVIRGAYGTLKDSWYDVHIEQTEEVPHRIVYQYLRSHVEIERQIDAILEITMDDEPDAYACDFEKLYNKPSAAFARNALTYCQRMLSETDGKRILFYSSPSVIQEWMFYYGVYWVRDYADLWLAQWPYTVPDNIAYDWSWKPRLPAGCTEWRMWQYSADGNNKGTENGVESRDVDLNIFNGTVDDMRVWLGEEGQTTPAPPVDEYGRGYNDGMSDVMDYCEERMS